MNKRTTVTVNREGATLEVSGLLVPRVPRSWQEPGSDAYVENLEVRHAGADITELLSQATIEDLEEALWNEKACESEYRRLTSNGRRPLRHHDERGHYLTEC